MFTTVRFLLLFLPIAFLIYWRCQKGGTGLQNAVLVLASFLFYALWDAGACGLLLAVAVISYLSGLCIDRMKFAGSPLAPLNQKGRTGDAYKLPKAMVVYLIKVAKDVKDRGGRFVLLPPAYRRAAYLKDKAYYDALQRDLQEKGIGFVKPIERYTFEEGLMYDTAYHLNGLGVALRTNLLAEDISEVLVNE